MSETAPPPPPAAAADPVPEKAPAAGRARSGGGDGGRGFGRMLLSLLLLVLGFAGGLAAWPHVAPHLPPDLVALLPQPAASPAPAPTAGAAASSAVAAAPAPTSGAAAADAAAGAPPITVTVTRSEPAEIPQSLSLTGSITAAEEAEVTLDVDTARIAALHAREGDTVTEGQLLAELDLDLIRIERLQAEAALARAQASAAQSEAQRRTAQTAVAEAQANLNRFERLVRNNAVARADRDAAAFRRESAAAELQAARRGEDVAAADIRTAKAALEAIDRRLARGRILSPVAGRILERPVRLGQTVGASSGPLFRIAVEGRMEMAALVTDERLAQIPPQAEARISVAGLPEPIVSRIDRILPVVTQGTRQGEIRLLLGQDPALRPGGFASAEIALPPVTARWLPDTAVFFDGPQAYVLTVTAENRIRRQPVTLGRRMEGRVAIEGLDAETRVVARSGAFLAEGEAVTPFAAGETLAEASAPGSGSTTTTSPGSRP